MLTVLCSPVAAFVAPSVMRRRAGVFPEHNKKALVVGPLGVGEEIGELAKVVDLSSIFLLFAPAAALAAGQVAQAQKNKLAKQVAETEDELEEIKDQIKSTDAQIAVSGVVLMDHRVAFPSCFSCRS